MASSPPPRIELAHTPTPLQRLDRTSEALGIDLWVKRDDLTGSALSGNKVRKLEFLLAEAEAQGADTLITCGAVTSNHCRATSVAAARRGLGCHLLLRGDEPVRPDGNLLLDRLVGAHPTFITVEQWRARDALMETEAEDLRRRGRRPYVIPEGGSNAVGAWGYVRGGLELEEQARAQGLDLRHVVHATGSGGTTAGLALAFAGGAIDVTGVAVCDDRAYFDGVVRRICDEFAAHGDAAAATASRRARWRILEGYKGVGYAQVTSEELRFYVEIARREGLVLDPVYSGKAFRALCQEARAGRIGREGTTVFLHTGGIFGLFSFADQIAEVL